MRIVVFGANGPTGRRLVNEALIAGHDIRAVTRHPENISEQHGLAPVRADVTNGAAVDAAIAGGEVILSVLGVPYSRKPITAYSTGAANIVSAMGRHGVKRLVITSSAAIVPGYRASESVLFTRVMEPLFMHRPGRTLYDDLRRMESLVRASDVDWTIVRPCWLFDAPTVTDYDIVENVAHGMFTSRADLAACLLRQLDDERFIRKAIGVTTTAVEPHLVRQIWREVIRKEKKD